MIRTVTGDINDNEIGCTLSHEHLYFDLRKVRNDNDSYIVEYGDIKEELNEISKLGINTIVEVTTIDMQRNVEKLKKISLKSGINIIASTGFYLHEYHSESMKEMSIDEIANIFIKEITEGIEGTSIKAGVIGEIATSLNNIYESEQKVFEAASIAANKCGCAITTHCQSGTMALEQIEIFSKYNVDLSKVILGHMDLNLDRNYLTTILQTGVNIGFDTYGKTSYNSDEDRTKMLLELIELGFENQIVISQDISRRSYLKNFGGVGYDHISKTLNSLLNKNIITQDILNKLLIENPKRIFSIKELAI